ncbi:hypothetical protein HF521_019322 [Silurus meridionalis]|uniref:Uncharacterized protein n=1 Tax=Silurus meridionalis TaxID=175797 RepID=A0A8T0BG68_SILME|nr:hypothetical protein HF521_019322 [Silurus meridionalis]
MPVAETGKFWNCSSRLSPFSTRQPSQLSSEPLCCEDCLSCSGMVSDHRNSIHDVPLGILFEHTDLQPPNSLHFNSSIGIILEGQMVMDKMPDLTQAMCVLFGIIYALDLNYPKSLANTFDFIQRVLMSMGQNALKPKVQSLANQLYC